MPPNGSGPKDKVDQELDDLGLEYGRYLQQVVSALEADKEFSAKLENASVEAIKSGSIADQLHFVDHNIRSKLDELKRIELERLHKLTMREKMLKQKLEHDPSGNKGKDNHHLDKENPHSFEVEDLHRLILAATRDLEAIDSKRKQEFKEYEMKKELEFRSQLAQAANESERASLIQSHEEAIKRHSDHPRVHHPGSRAQLEEVWQEEDHLPKNEFDPKTFFSLHDLNGDGYLDVQEVEALLSLEVRKLYDPKHNPEAEDDPREMMEEFHRMREHIYKEADKDRDGLISRKEFLDLTSSSDFESKEKEGWNDIGSDPSAATRGHFSEQELSQYYERLHHRQQQQQQQMMMMQQGQRQGLHAQQAQQYYGYEHAPPPPEYYAGHHPSGGAGQQQQQQYGSQGSHHPQFVPLQHPGQGAQHHQQQQQQYNGQQHPGQQQQQQQHYQQYLHEQQVNYNGQVYGMPQDHQQQQQLLAAQQQQAQQHHQQQQQQQAGLPTTTTTTSCSCCTSCCCPCCTCSRQQQQELEMKDEEEEGKKKITSERTSKEGMLMIMMMMMS